MASTPVATGRHACSPAAGARLLAHKHVCVQQFNDAHWLLLLLLLMMRIPEVISLSFTLPQLALTNRAAPPPLAAFRFSFE